MQKLRNWIVKIRKIMSSIICDVDVDTRWDLKPLELAVLVRKNYDLGIYEKLSSILLHFILCGNDVGNGRSELCFIFFEKLCEHVHPSHWLLQIHTLTCKETPQSFRITVWEVLYPNLVSDFNLPYLLSPDRDTTYAASNEASAL